jgi:hypothetical protein
MVQQRLAPGVQHGRNAQLGLEAVLTKLQQSLAGGVEQQVVEGALVLLDQRVERVRQRKHQVEIRHRQQRLLLLGQPVFGRLTLAKRAMPVAAGMRHKVSAATLQAPVAMTTQCRGAASQQRIKNAPMMLGQGWTRAGDADSQHCRQAQPSHRSRRPAAGHEGCGSLGLGLAGKTAQVQQLQWTLNLRQSFLAHVQVVGSGRQVGVP